MGSGEDSSKVRVGHHPPGTTDTLVFTLSMKNNRPETTSWLCEGFWRSSKNANEDLPWPEPDPSWARRSIFLDALDRAEAEAQRFPAAGFSLCRLCGCMNGSQQLVLEPWQWPEGYRHYIEIHQVRPSSNFESFIERQTQ